MGGGEDHRGVQEARLQGLSLGWPGLGTRTSTESSASKGAFMGSSALWPPAALAARGWHVASTGLSVFSTVSPGGVGPHEPDSTAGGCPTGRGVGGCNLADQPPGVPRPVSATLTSPVMSPGLCPYAAICQHSGRHPSLCHPCTSWASYAHTHPLMGGTPASACSAVPTCDPGWGYTLAGM